MANAMLSSIQQMIHSTVPVISTNDIQKAVTYYTEVLGFLPDFEYGDPVVYAGVKSGNAEIYFTHEPEQARLIIEKEMHPEIFIWISDADKLFETHTKNGAEIVEHLADRPWGAKQYIIREINGYHLKFAQPI